MAHSFIKEIIDSLKARIEHSDTIEQLKRSVKEFGLIHIPTQDLIECRLVDYINATGRQWPAVKEDTDRFAKTWQRQVDLWMAEENNLAEKHRSEKLFKTHHRSEPSKQPVDTRKENQRHSGHMPTSDSFNSRQVESPDSQKHIQRNSIFNFRSNNSPAEENNLAEKHRSEKLFRTHHRSEPSKQPVDARKENQRHSGYVPTSDSFNSRQVESPDSQKHIQRNSTFNFRSNNSFTSNNSPSFHRKSSSPSQLDNPGSQNSNSAECNAHLSIDPTEVTLQKSPVKPIERFHVEMQPGQFKAVKEKTPPDPNHIMAVKALCDYLYFPPNMIPSYVSDYIESQDRLHKENSDSMNCVKSLNGKDHKKMDSHHLPSTSQGSKQSSKSCRESMHQESKQSSKSCRESTHQESKQSSKSCPESRHDRKRKQMESTQSVVKVKKLKEEQQPSLAGKLKNRETNHSVAEKKERRKIEEPKEQPKRVFKVAERQLKELKSKEPQATQVRALKCIQTTQPAAKAKELRVEQKPFQDSKFNLDAKRAFEARHCDKNNIKKRESPDQSALIAITSSKKERTSVYHGGKKGDLPKLKDMCTRTLLKQLKQSSDPTKYINKDASFQDLETILVQLSPELLLKLEEHKKYLIASTDLVWKLNCERKFKQRVHLRKKDEPWRVFFQRCNVESNQKLEYLKASISTTKVKPDRQIMLTTANGPPNKRLKTDSTVVLKTVNVPSNKRLKTDSAVAAKCNGYNSTVKPLPNATHPSNSKPVVPFLPKANHIKPAHRTIKKDAPLMHKAKKTLGQLNRIRRS